MGKGMILLINQTSKSNTRCFRIEFDNINQTTCIASLVARCWDLIPL